MIGCLLVSYRVSMNIDEWHNAQAAECEHSRRLPM